jgi:hypothetical protein
MVLKNTVCEVSSATKGHETSLPESSIPREISKLASVVEDNTFKNSRIQISKSLDKFDRQSETFETHFHLRGPLPWVGESAVHESRSREGRGHA